ncbi:SAM-dependent methyltransferase [Candidatus Daviesbacteria bacterium]|nr:SAM-dependent methyltransferase [Candidatus Daviesbacteria bacterium]
MKNDRISASFKDPSGFVFSIKELIYRQINKSYQDNYQLLINSGLYDKLVSSNLLIEHQEIDLKNPAPEAYKIIKPKQIPFISYPYEWCFGMLKDAAFLTLNIQKIALEHGLSLKDASAFNIQFLKGKPILIDTLSFEKYGEGKPWIAYKQFVEHFLAPLTLMSLTDFRLNRLSSFFINGIPLDLASKLLPFRSHFKPGVMLHIHAHAASQKKYHQKKLSSARIQKSFSKRAFLGLLDNLEGVIKSLSWNTKDTQWSEYYSGENNNYTSSSLTQKGELVKGFLKSIKSKTIWDLGANTGYFSRIAKQFADLVISFDLDLGALEKNYQQLIKDHETNILPLFIDLTNPTPSLGWANEERLSLFQRGPADVTLALALVHHLAISANIPLSYIASLFSKLSKYLIIEFIPKEDSQVKILLQNREDIFPAYTKAGFEEAFKEFFQIKKICPIKNSQRILYLMEKTKR